MKFAGKFLAAAAVVAAGLAPAAAGEFDVQINARKGQMNLRAFNLGTMFAMAKGDVPYDAEKAKKAANNLVILSGLGDGAMWPKGSDSTANKGATRAKAEAWASDSEAGKMGKALGEAQAKLVEVAGDGAEAMTAQLKAIGGACTACHKKYREEE